MHAPIKYAGTRASGDGLHLYSGDARSNLRQDTCYPDCFVAFLGLSTQMLGLYLD
jgi:hypothetical protein